MKRQERELLPRRSGSWAMSPGRMPHPRRGCLSGWLHFGRQPGRVSYRVCQASSLFWFGVVLQAHRCVCEKAYI